MKNNNIRPYGALGSFVGFAFEGTGSASFVNLSSYFPHVGSDGRHTLCADYMFMETDGAYTYTSLPAVMCIPEARLEEAKKNQVGVYDSEVSEHILRDVLNKAIEIMTNHEGAFDKLDKTGRNIEEATVVTLKKIVDDGKPRVSGRDTKEITMHSTISFLAKVVAITHGETQPTKEFCSGLKLPQKFERDFVHSQLATILAYTIVQREKAIQGKDAEHDISNLVAFIRNNSGNKTILTHVNNEPGSEDISSHVNSAVIENIDTTVRRRSGARRHTSEPRSKP